MKIERKSGREITKTNNDIYKIAVDNDIIIQKVIKKDKVFMCGLPTKVETVLFVPVLNNYGEISEYRDDLVVIKPEKVPNGCALLDCERPLSDFKNCEFSLNQILGAYGMRKYGNDYNVDDDLYMTPIYYSRDLTNVIVYEDFLINVKRCDVINLKSLKPVRIKDPLDTKDGKQDNKDYFMVAGGKLKSSNYVHYKCFTLLKIDKEFLPKKIGLFNGVLKTTNVVAHLIDNNKLNNSIKNLKIITYSDNIKITNRREVLRYEIEDKFKNVVHFHKFKALVDYIYNLKIIKNNNIYDISNYVFNIIKNKSQSSNKANKIGDYIIREVIDDDRILEWENKHKVKPEYNVKTTSGNITSIVHCNNAKEADIRVAGVTGLKVTSAGRYRRNDTNTEDISENPSNRSVTVEKIKPKTLLFDKFYEEKGVI